MPELVTARGILDVLVEVALPLGIASSFQRGPGDEVLAAKRLLLLTLLLLLLLK
jgi:hypothetical protein